MEPVDAPRDELAALLEERAFLRLPYRVIRVVGDDAGPWLQDLVTADVASLDVGRSRRSLVLTPTGRVRADLTLVRDHEGFLLLQAETQPETADTILLPYVLSADVRLEDVTDRSILFTVSGLGTWSEFAAFTPAAAGPGRGFVTEPERVAELAGLLEEAGLMQVGLDALEAWRILRGLPRMGADFDADSLAAGSGLDSAIDRTKGCFLGQESVARVANLGHPPRILRRLRAPLDVDLTGPVMAGGVDVGSITSAAFDLQRQVFALATVRWGARDADLTTASGVPVFDVESAN